MDFCTKLAALRDIGQHKGRFSCILQKVGVMPWEKFAASEDFVDSLRVDARTLRGALGDAEAADASGSVRPVRPDQKRWRHLLAAWGGLSAPEPTYRGQALTGGPKDFKAACTKVADYCDALAAAIGRRLEKAGGQMVNTGGHWPTTGKGRWPLAHTGSTDWRAHASRPWP